ncbi:MAG: glycosyltransferase family 2 protein [Pseudomonadota bacterium]
MLSIIIPANNEEGYIDACLSSLAVQEGDNLDRVEIIVAANACRDATVAQARSRAPAFEARGWTLTVLDIAEGGKPNALNEGDRAASGGMRLYLDADIVCSAAVVSEIVAALDRPGPVYAGGMLEVAPARSWITRHYARLWTNLPFMRQSGTTGAGLFAVNAAGRARWGPFPRIISDDTYVRLLFRPCERTTVPASYLWPMVEGFSALVRVRRRQDDGLREIAAQWPGMFANEGKPALGAGDHLALFMRQPVSYIVYTGVALAVRFGRGGAQQGWARGR